MLDCLLPLLGSSPRCSLAHCSGSATNLSQPLPTAHSYSLASPNFARKFRFSKTRGTVDSLSMDKLYPDCLQLQCMMRIFSVWECASWELVLVSPQSAAADSISDNEAANNLFTLTTGHTHINVILIQSTVVTLTRRDGTPHVIRDITPLKLDLMRRYITHCQCITVSQSHHYPKCPHDIMVTVSAKCGVSMFPNTTKWIIDWCWLVLAHNDHICVTFAVATSPANGHIYTATYCITCTGWHHKYKHRYRYNGDDTGNKVCVVKYNLAVSCLCCGIETGTVTIMTRYSYLNWDGLYLFLHLVLITVSIPLPG